MIERVVTSGTFSLDGQDFEVDINVWLVGDEREVLVIDAAHDPAPILAAINGRSVVGSATQVHSGVEAFPNLRCSARSRRAQ